jgi:hypothetical protein
MKGTVLVFMIVAVIAYVVFESETARELVFKWRGAELGMKQGGAIPPKSVPDSSSQPEESESKPTKPLSIQKSAKQPSTEEKVIPTNLALNKPVAYLPKRIIINGKEWDGDGYYERYSIDKANYPSNLTDGNPNTVAYPASWFLDYIVDLGEVYKIDKINLFWGNFGKRGSNIYITAWRLSSQKELTVDWELVESHDYLDEEKTSLNLAPPISARRLRIYAESIDRDKLTLLNWIGIYELQVYGKPVEK